MECSRKLQHGIVLYTFAVGELSVQANFLDVGMCANGCIVCACSHVLAELLGHCADTEASMCTKHIANGHHSNFSMQSEPHQFKQVQQPIRVFLPVLPPIRICVWLPPTKWVSECITVLGVSSITSSLHKAHRRSCTCVQLGHDFGEMSMAKSALMMAFISGLSTAGARSH